MPLPLIAWAAIAAGSAAASYLGYKTLSDDSGTGARSSGDTEASARRKAEDEAALKRQAQANIRRKRHRQQTLEGGLDQLRHELKPLGLEITAQAAPGDVERFAKALPGDIEPRYVRLNDGLSQITGISRAQLDDFGLLLGCLNAYLDYDPQQGIAAQLEEVRGLQQQLDSLASIQQFIKEAQRP